MWLLMAYRLAVLSVTVPAMEVVLEAANMNVVAVVLPITFNGGSVIVTEIKKVRVNSENIRNPRYSPSLCVTHNCNLNCVYCYQKHDTS